MPDFVPFLHIHNIVPEPVALLNIPTIVSLIYRNQDPIASVQDLENVSLPCVHILSLLGILRQTAASVIPSKHYLSIIHTG